MHHVELLAPARTDLFVIETIVRYKLEAKLQSLESYPGSLHWTLEMPGQPGKLEVTFWPKRSRLWLSHHYAEEAPWIEEMIQCFIERFGRKLESA